MRVAITADFDGLGDALAKLLPDGLTPTSVSLTATRLRVEGTARKWKLSKTVVLVADVESVPGGIRLRGFDLEGAMGLGGGALADLKKAIGTLDSRAGPFRARGEQGGDHLVVSWS